MKSLWAPWRMEFITGTQTGACPFCDLPKKSPSVTNLVLFKGKHSFIILNKFPYTNGHLMVIPYRHLADYSLLTKAEHSEMGQLMSKAIQALKKELAPHGFNTGMNLGRAAGAGIEEHLHYHVVPRWMGDNNFMPVLGGAKVIPEFIHQTYKKLKKHF